MDTVQPGKLADEFHFMAAMDLDSVELLTDTFDRNLHRSSTPLSHSRRTHNAKTTLSSVRNKLNEDSGIGSLPSTVEKDSNIGWKPANDFEFRGIPLPKQRLDDEFELFENEDSYTEMLPEVQLNTFAFANLNVEPANKTNLSLDVVAFPDCEMSRDHDVLSSECVKETRLPLMNSYQENRSCDVKLISEPNMCSINCNSTDFVKQRDFPACVTQLDTFSLKHFSNSSNPCTKLEYVDKVLESISNATAAYMPTPSHRLIGVNCGLQELDIVSELSVHNCYQPLKLIFSYVEASDLCRMSKVCSQWRNAVCKDSLAKKKRLSQHSHIDKENSVRFEKQSVARNGSQQEPLGAIHNIIGRPTVSQPTRSNLFPFQIRLAEHEILQRCPNCFRQSCVDKEFSRGKCTNQQCAFDYCINCHAAYTMSHSCERRVVAGTVASATNTVGAKRSRNNLRRL